MPSGTWVDELVPCRNPECDGQAEPEQDGDDLRYYACTEPECGFEFGHVRVRQQSGTCQLGVPEAVRARFSQPAGQAPPPVLLQIGRRPE
jgi:hypothetical protein